MDDRTRRAIALACATVVVRDKHPEMEMLLSIADEFIQYIEGDDSALITRPESQSRQP